jgi:L,D-transpeptidase YcbB
MGCKHKTRLLWNKDGNGDNPPRNYSINHSNAYNDLFLDSLVFEKFIVANVSEDSISENMRDFYKVRNFEYAWFDSNGLNEQALGFRSVYKFSSDSVNKKLDRQLDELLMHDANIDSSDASIQQIELQLTRQFVLYTLDLYQKNPENRHQFETYVPMLKQDMLEMADSILHDQENKNYASVTPEYQNLKETLSQYMVLYKKNGWMPVMDTKNVWTVGKLFPEISSLKKRLMVTGEWASRDTSLIFTAELAEAVKAYQQTNGFHPDGKNSALLIANMNIPVINRIQQQLINLERMRWMPIHKEGKLLLVNIPEFMLHVTEGEKHVIHMPVVVGKEAHQTTMFADDMNEIVFSPYWNIPSSIVRKEILPAMEKNNNYLAKHHMEMVSSGGGTPVIRQLPGAFNSLGKVKFLFPNSFSIYFHDTPAKSIFGNNDRASSHGCIRLSDPVKMANYLLKDDPKWTAEKIKTAMNSGVKQSVFLKNSVPVIITYFTAWVDENKKLNFRNDVYGNDQKVAAKLFFQPL